MIANLQALDETERRELYSLLRAKDLQIRRSMLANYRPYAKQMEFHARGAKFRERLFMAGNQSGKTLAGAAEMAIHLTGEYPSWWEGVEFRYPIRAIAGSESAELTKRGVQRLLLGAPEKKEEWGTGMIPHAALRDTSPRAGVPDAVSSIVVRHKSGDDSVLQLLSYDQGRTKWQADTVDYVWMDEEPPMALYSEALTRTNATGGLVSVTFTPLLGMSDVVARFLRDKPPGTCVTNMTIDDVDHYTPEEREAIIAAWPEHERQARARGEPALGSGRVFPFADSAIAVEPFPLPPHWPRIAAIDFGIDHPTAVAWLAWDRDSDTIYVYDAYRQTDGGVLQHAPAIRARGEWIPVAWPHDGLQRDKGSGQQIAEQYRAQFVNMLPDRVTFEDGSNGVEAGLSDMFNRFQTRRLRIFSHLSDVFEEVRLYHRKDGQVVRKIDDLMSAIRYGVMGKRFAKTQSEAEVSLKQKRSAAPVIPFSIFDPVAGY